MKKLILILVVGFVALAASAQSSGNFTAFVADTTTNSETEYLVIDSPKAIGLNHAVAIYAVPEDVSGTATVTAMPQWSPDNVIWLDAQSSADTIVNAGTGSTLSWTFADAYGKYYRVKLVSIGTGVEAFTGALGLKRK